MISRILAITNSSEDASLLLSWLAIRGWTTEWVSNCQDALFYIVHNTTSLVICESSLPDGTWKTILNALQLMEDPPLLIVFPSCTDPTLCMDAMNLEGYKHTLNSLDSAEIAQVIPAIGSRKVLSDTLAGGDSELSRRRIRRDGESDRTLLLT